MRYTIISVFFLAGITLSATDTLECNSANYLVQLHINSLGEIADCTVYGDMPTKYPIDISSLEINSFEWKDRFNQHKTNAIHIKTRKGHGHPQIELQIEGSSGFIIVGELKEECICTWD